MALVTLNVFGNAGLVMEQTGELTTDLYGLSTCTTVWKCPQDRLDLIPPMFSYHPVFTYVNMERRRVKVGNDGYLTIVGEFAGIPGDTTPIYEVVVGLSEQPIETHPKFVTDIAGKPSAPLNGAVFLDEQGKPTTDDAVGIFDRFRSVADGIRNPFAGIAAYLEASEVTFREIYMSTARPSDATLVGTIQGPAGPAPGVTSPNWLYMGLTYQQRGLCYAVTREWRAGGRNGWNTTIYSS